MLGLIRLHLNGTDSPARYATALRSWLESPNGTPPAQRTERARAFYQRLGWEGQEVEETVFIHAGGIASHWHRMARSPSPTSASPSAGSFGYPGTTRKSRGPHASERCDRVQSSM